MTNVPAYEGGSGNLLSEAAALVEEYAAATGVPCALIDARGKVIHPGTAADYPCWICRIARGTLGEDRPLGEDHVEWAQMARRYGGRQVFLCPSSLTHWVVPLEHDGELAGALIGGPVRSVDEKGFFEEEILFPLRHSSAEVARAQAASLRSMFERVPLVSPKRIHALTEQLFRAALSIQGAQAGINRETSERLLRESRINEHLQELKQYRDRAGLDPEVPTYPLDKEQRLLDAIADGDTEGAQAALNELLGHVFFTFGADVEPIKNRAREIAILLSRISLSRGADAAGVFGLNYQFLDELHELTDANEVAHWMARIVRRFAGVVLAIPRGAVHVSALRAVIDYVHRSYAEGVNITEAARLAGLSPSYLSEVFSREMGEPFSRFVQRTRLRRARELVLGSTLPLSDIASLCGFADQSHMTRIFRRIAGTTPARLRQQRWAG